MQNTVFISDGNTSCVLRYVDQRIWSDQECLDSLTGYYYENFANFSIPTDVMMCVGYREGGKAACHVILQGQNNSVYLISELNLNQ